jgi:TRAP-type uncharacterized transport system fused permease subunit
VQPTLALAIYLTCLALVVAGGVAAARNRTTGRVALGIAVAVELVVLAQVVVAAVRLLAGTRPHEQATFIGYLAGVVVVLPVAVGWSLAERTRWNGVVLAVGAFTVAIMTARLQMMWRSA